MLVLIAHDGSKCMGEEEGVGGVNVCGAAMLVLPPLSLSEGRVAVGERNAGLGGSPRSFYACYCAACCPGC